MSTIIMRSALIHWHGKAPKGVHSIVNDHLGRRVVTFDEVRRERWQRHEQNRLSAIRAAESRAFKLWVAYFGQDLMGGWQAFIENRNGCEWIDRDRRFLMSTIMDLFPLLLWNGRLDRLGKPFGWEEWKMAFAAQFKRRIQCCQPVGVAYLWQRGRDFVRVRSGEKQ